MLNFINTWLMKFLVTTWANETGVIFCDECVCFQVILCAKNGSGFQFEKGYLEAILWKGKTVEIF